MPQGAVEAKPLLLMMTSPTLNSLNPAASHDNCLESQFDMSVELKSNAVGCVDVTLVFAEDKLCIALQHC